MKWNQHPTGKRVIVVTALAAIVVSSIGCGVMRPVRGRRGAAVHAGFLGDYSKLANREGYPAQEIYIKEDVPWPKYDAIYIESVTMWIRDEAKQPPPAEQQMLTDMLYRSMHDKLSEHFRIADRPGAGVLRLRMAITEEQGAKVALNALTTVIPQARAIAAVGGLGTDTAILVGSARMEGEVLDSITNERLAAVVDARAGTKGVTRAFSKWADVQAISDYWAERALEFFVKQGVRPKA